MDEQTIDSEDERIISGMLYTYKFNSCTYYFQSRSAKLQDSSGFIKSYSTEMRNWFVDVDEGKI